MDNYLQQRLYKKEVIKEQYFDIKSNTLWIITKSYDNWTLYNHTQDKKIATSKDLLSLHKKIPNYYN